MSPELVIETRGLRKSYHSVAGEQLVLSDVDLQVRAGEFVVVVGRSGSGKSTLLTLLGAMDQATAGEVLVNGQDITRLDEEGRTLFRRRHVGFVFQAYNLLPTLTVAENLLLPLQLNQQDDHQSSGRIRHLLQELGIGNKADVYADQLSGGERQRVAIARALIHQPSFVIADEPTGNLDLDTGQQVLQLLDRLTRAEGRTMIMATHSQEVIGIADRIMTIADGCLREVEAGP